MPVDSHSKLTRFALYIDMEYSSTSLCVALQPSTSLVKVQPVGQLVRDTAGVMQEYTQRGGVRPFGVSLLVAGYDDDGPQLFQVMTI